MQGKLRLLATISGLTALTLTAPAFAVMSAPNGWYLEGNIGSSRLSNINFNGSKSKSGIAGNIDVGYKFMPFFGLEAGYTSYSTTNVKDPTTNTTAGNAKTYAMDLAGKGIIPVGDSGVEGFAKVGMSRINTHISLSNSVAASNIGLNANTSNTVSLYLAVGGSYYFSPDLAVNIQWAQAQGNTKTGTGNLVTVGINYNFG